VAELVDALVSGTSGSNPVEVQVLSSAPIRILERMFENFILEEFLSASVTRYNMLLLKKL
jgi:hypothetical protein